MLSIPEEKLKEACRYSSVLSKELKNLFDDEIDHGIKNVDPRDAKNVDRMKSIVRSKMLTPRLTNHEVKNQDRMKIDHGIKNVDHTKINHEDKNVRDEINSRESKMSTSRLILTVSKMLINHGIKNVNILVDFHGIKMMNKLCFPDV